MCTQSTKHETKTQVYNIFVSFKSGFTKALTLVVGILQIIKMLAQILWVLVSIYDSHSIMAVNAT